MKTHVPKPIHIPPKKVKYVDVDKVEASPDITGVLQ